MAVMLAKRWRANNADAPEDVRRDAYWRFAGMAEAMLLVSIEERNSILSELRAILGMEAKA